MTLTQILAFLGVLSPLVAVITYITGTKKEIKTDGQDQGELRADIKYIRNGVEDIRVDMRVQDSKIDGLTERVTRVEESAKQAHHRVDEIKNTKG
ncbi:MAG: hypothetical protein AB9856_03835 [Cellulosilyticaceae bacterium]